MFLNFGYEFNKEPSTPKERIRIKIAAHKGSEIMWIREHCINGAQTHQSSLLELTFSISKKDPILGTYFRLQTCEKTSKSWSGTDDGPNLNPILTSSSKTQPNHLVTIPQWQCGYIPEKDTDENCWEDWHLQILHTAMRCNPPSLEFRFGSGFWVSGFSV